jgi:hypothetical protein
MKNLVIALAIIFLALPTSIISMNAGGVCVAKGRVLKEEQIVHVGVAHLMEVTREKGASFIERNGMLVDRGEPQNHGELSYESVDDLMSRNPGCCHLVQEIERLGRRPSLVDRFFGQARGYVDINYRRRTRLPTGIVETRDESAFVQVSNCGRVVGD